MNITELRKYRVDIETPPFFNNQNVGIALFDVFTAFLGAYILEELFNLSKYIPYCKKKKVIIYYLLVIPFGILVHHVIAHIKSIRENKSFMFPEEITFLNKKLFTLKPNIYHVLLIILFISIYKTC